MTFLKSETGAVTVDWVVLTAGLVGLGLAAMSVVSIGVQDTSEDIESQLGADIIRTAFFEPMDWGGGSIGFWGWTDHFRPIKVNQHSQESVETLHTELTADLDYLQGLLDSGGDLSAPDARTASDDVIIRMTIIDDNGYARPSDEEDIQAMMLAIAPVRCAQDNRYCD